MSKALPWVRFFPSDWLAGTRGLSPRTTALYITTIALMYEKDGPIQPDLDWLSRYCSMGKKQTADALAALIEKGKLKVLDDGRVSNERAEREIEIRNKASDSQRQRSQSGWAKKRSKTNGPAMPGQSPSDAGPMPTRVQTQNQKEKEERAIALSKKKRVATRLSEAWKIPPEWVAEATGEGMAYATAQAEAERMKNWSLSSPAGAKLDWHATWRNWFRKLLANGSHRATAPPGEKSNLDPETERAHRFLEGVIAKGAKGGK